MAVATAARAALERLGLGGPADRFAGEKACGAGLNALKNPAETFAGGLEAVAAAASGGDLSSRQMTKHSGSKDRQLLVPVSIRTQVPEDEVLWGTPRKPLLEVKSPSSTPPGNAWKSNFHLRSPFSEASTRATSSSCPKASLAAPACAAAARLAIVFNRATLRCSAHAWRKLRANATVALPELDSDLWKWKERCKQLQDVANQQAWHFVAERWEAVRGETHEEQEEMCHKASQSALDAEEWRARSRTLAHAEQASKTDFCGKGGYVDSMGYDISMTRAPIDPLRSEIQGPAAVCWCGEVIDKPGKGSFVATDLDLILKQKKVKNLILTGITTDVCVGTTMREANDLGYECLLLSDCTAATDYGNYMATLKTMQQAGGVFGCVAAAADLLKAIGEKVPAALEASLSDVDLGDGLCVKMPKPQGQWMPQSLAETIVAPQSSKEGYVKARVCGGWGRKMHRAFSEWCYNVSHVAMECLGLRGVKSRFQVASNGLAIGCCSVRQADPYLWPFDGQLRTDNTALMSINFQTNILDPDGDFAKSDMEEQNSRAKYFWEPGDKEVVKKSAEVLQMMRRKGFPVLHIRTGHAENLSDSSRRASWRSEQRPRRPGPLGRLVRGDPGWDFVPQLAALPGEAVVDKPGIGAFSLTSLELNLQSLGVRNLVIIGVATDVCVHTTMRQANDRGYECLLLSNCTAAAFPETYFSALKQIKMQHGVFGAVADSPALLEAMNRSTQLYAEPSLKVKGAKNQQSMSSTKAREAARDHYGLPDNLWQAFTAVAGDPGEDLRLLAVLPPTVVSAALERSQLEDGSYLSAVQASHVGLVYNLARRIQHTKGGGDWDSWKESSPFGTTSNAVELSVPKATDGQTPERKLKLSQVLDQADDGEFVVQTEAARAEWYQQYVSVVGGWPLEEEEPSLEQMSALQRRLQVQDVAPYADFAIYVPFGQRALRASKWRTFVATPDGYTARELPGPSNYTLWRTCYRLLRTSLIMLDAVGLAALHSYEMHLERLARLYPSAWHLLYAADEVARSAQSNRIRARILMDVRMGKAAPEGFDASRPWDYVFGALPKDDAFWQAQVHGPALAWIAGGSRGHEGGHTVRTMAQKEASREEKFRRWRRPKIYKGRKQRRRKGFRKDRKPAEVLQLEQRKWTLWVVIAGTEMSQQGSTPSQVYDMRLSRASQQGLPEEDLKPQRHAGGEHHPGQEGIKSEKQTNVESAKDEDEYTYEYETDSDDSDEGKEDPGGNEEEVPLQSETIEEYFTKRVFIFVHHFAGASDPLTSALRNEALNQGIRLKAFSVERDSGTGGLLEDEPYSKHLQWARNGYIDIYHAGFPCSSFSRLRHRRAEGMRGPVRSRTEPYGLSSNSKAAQQEADNGTVMASRAIDMACAVKNAPRITTTERVATLENPPPSGLEEHLSAWELPEMRKFLHAEGVNTVIFNTCGYEEHLPVGSRHYKPQQFSGMLRDIAKLKRSCGCGSPGNHEAITGPVKSKASATYPDDLCKEYAKLAVEQLKLIGKEEFLKSRMKSLQDTIDAAKARIIRREHPGMSERSIRKQRPRTRSPKRRPQNLPSMSPPTRREYKAATLDPRGRSPLQRKRKGGDEAAEPERKKVRRRTGDSRVQLKPAKDVQTWQGGEGKHEMLRPSSSKTKDPKLQEYLGGMRDPYKVVQPLSTMLNLGLRIRAAWELFERKFSSSNEVAETFGTPACSMNPQLVKEWKASLKKVLGAQAPPSLKIKPRWGYQSPLDAELFEAWIAKANDPDVCIPSWIRAGVPLGIEEPIPVNGIFPLNNDDTGPDPLGSNELEDAAMQLSRGDMTNYSSVLDHLEDSKIELERYRKEGYMVDVDKDTVTKEMSHGTISRLGLIIKEKPEGVKRRIILDLRRSGGNRKAVLPEKLILPRPRDAVASIRNVYEQRRPHGADEGYTRELAVVDISDAFMSFAVCEKELPHTLAPNVESQDFYLFVALLFGYKTAPLLWSRLASMIGRFLQSLVQGKEGQHQIYLDDALWALQGTLRERNSVLAMIITTLFALGLKVSLKKGLRSSQVQWVGVRFTLTEDSVILGLPEKFMAAPRTS
eukprot:s218_g41.t2